MFILSLHRQSRRLSLLTVVLFGFVWPLAYISAGGLYTEAEKAAVIWPLGAGTFFPLTTAKKGENKIFLTMQCRLLPAAWVKKKKKHSGKSQEITTGTVILKVWWLTSQHCTSCFLLWTAANLAGGMCCTVVSGSWISPKHTFYLQPCAYRLRTLMHISPFTVCHSLVVCSLSTAWRRLTISET